MSRKVLRLALTAIFVCIGLAGAAVAAPTLPVTLTVQERNGVARNSEPVTFGVPIPENLGITQTSSLGIWSGAQQIPAQFRVNARWRGAPDDSSKPIKWLLVDFQATVSANGASVYTLNTGGAGTASGSNLASISGSTITVNSGPLKFTVNEQRFNLFDTAYIDLNGDGSFTNNEQIISASANNGAIVQDSDGINDNIPSNDGSTDTTFTSSASSPSEFIIEENGPLKAVVAVAGRYTSTNDGVLHMKYRTRIYVYKDKSYVRVRHSYANGLLCDTDDMGCTDGWSQNPDAPEDNEFTDSISLDFALDLDNNPSYQLERERGATLSGTLGGGQTAYLQQDDTNNELSLKYTTNIAGNVTSGTSGRAEGFGDLSDANKGLTIAQRHFWEKYPKRMTVKGSGMISLGLAPIDDMLWEAMGVGNDVTFYFHGSDRSQISNVVYGFAKSPLMAVAPKAWYTESGAFGVLAPYPSATYPKYDQLIASNYTQAMDNRENALLYGATNFGGHCQGGCDAGDADNIDWSVNYYDAVYQQFHMFARTADPKYFQIGMEHAQHYMEVDCYNIYPGYARHATSGSSKGLYGISPSYQDYHRKNSHFVHNWGDGLFYYYYLSGDARAAELALRGARTMASRGDLDGTGRGGQQKNSWALGGYKLTHDPDLINPLIEQMASTMENYDGDYFDSGTSLRQEMGMYTPFLYDLYQETGDTTYRDAIVRIANWARTPDGTGGNSGGFLPNENPVPESDVLGSFWHYYGSQSLQYWTSRMEYNPGFGFAYLATGDPSYLDFIEPFFARELTDRDESTDGWGKGGQAFQKTIHLHGILERFFGVPADDTPPSVPGNLNASAGSQSEINLSWSAAADAESGVSSYLIYRDNVQVGQTGLTSYSDSGLAESTQYTYRVSALNGATLEGGQSSPASATTQSDSTPPTVVGAVASGIATRVTVTFSEPLEAASAGNPSNYSMNGGVTVNSADLGGDLETVTLQTSAMALNTTYTLTVNNVRDRAAVPNPIAANSTVEFTYVNNVTIDVRISSSEDDVEERSSVSTSSSDLELVFDGDDEQVVGLRFVGLAIPQGSVISSAWVQFTSDESSASESALTIRAEAVDNSQPFGEVSTRTMTNSSVAWSPPQWIKDQTGEDQRTPNLAGLMQEVVFRPGWSSGNAMVFVFTGTGTRTAEAWDSEPGLAPLLHVEFSVGGDPPTDPPDPPVNLRVQ